MYTISRLLVFSILALEYAVAEYEDANTNRCYHKCMNLVNRTKNMHDFLQQHTQSRFCYKAQVTISK